MGDSPYLQFLEAKMYEARPDQKHDNTIHDLSNVSGVAAAISMVD